MRVGGLLSFAAGLLRWFPGPPTLAAGLLERTGGEGLFHPVASKLHGASLERHDGHTMPDAGWREPSAGLLRATAAIQLRTGGLSKSLTR